MKLAFFSAVSTEFASIRRFGMRLLGGLFGLGSAAVPPLVTFPGIVADAIGVELGRSFVWIDGASNRAGRVVAFRRSFRLEASPRKAELHLFADARYVLWVNGVYVERGPSRFQPNGPEYDTVDLSSRLKVGENVLALVVAGNLSGGKVMRHEPGLAAALHLEGRKSLSTDTTWKASEATRYRKVAASWANLGDDLVDLRAEPPAWREIGFDDSKWTDASPVKDPSWGPLTARRIPPLREVDVPVALSNGCRLPVDLVSNEGVSFAIGRIAQAWLEVDFSAEEGSVLRLEPYGTEIIARAGRQSHFTFDSRALSAGAVKVTKGKVTLHGLRLVERLYPFDVAARFRSSDPFLEKLFDLSMRSCLLLSEDAWVDCAARERVEWMDNDPPGFSIARTAMVGVSKDGERRFADPRLLQVLVRRIGLSLQPEGWVKAHGCSDRYDIHAKMEDRACEWIAGLRRLVDATGDLSTVREVWPAVRAQLGYFLERRSPRGLVRARDWVVWDNPLRYQTGETATVNAFVHRALVDGASLAKELGFNEDARLWEADAADLARAIDATLWNEKAGEYHSAYFDEADEKEYRAYFDDGKKRMFKNPAYRMEISNHLAPPSLHAQLFLLERGPIPASKRARVERRLVERQADFGAGSVMVNHSLFLALYGLDRPELDARVLERLRSCWAREVASPWPYSTEGFGPGPNVHIYSMHAGYFLLARVLGVRRDDPVGRKRIIIEPHLGDLRHASGTVVTEFGPVEISWKVEGKVLRFEGRIPAGVEAALRLPGTGRCSLSFDGKKFSGSVKGNRTEIPLPAWTGGSGSTGIFAGEAER